MSATETGTASYLEQYDAADPQTKVALVSKWIRTDWRPFFKELRENRPILKTPGFTLLTRFADVTEVLSREKVFTVRPYQPHMDPVVGPFMLARDATPLNWREKGIMQAVLMPEDLPEVRETAGRLADEALDAAAPQGKIEGVGKLGRYVPLRIVGEYFGFPGPDLESMYRWSKATQTNMFKNLQNDQAIHEAAVKAGEEMKEYLTGLLAEKRAAVQSYNGEPPKDTFSRLVRTKLPPEIGFDDS
ncbi:MAG TPA: cytochrome P450, partial [Actinomycetota bacterium]|nr:cytochrome P450 [Actinomycetota bacterium]